MSRLCFWILDTTLSAFTGNCCLLGLRTGAQLISRLGEGKSSHARTEQTGDGNEESSLLPVLDSQTPSPDLNRNRELNQELFLFSRWSEFPDSHSFRLVACQTPSIFSFLAFFLTLFGECVAIVSPFYLNCCPLTAGNEDSNHLPCGRKPVITDQNRAGGGGNKESRT